MMLQGLFLISMVTAVLGSGYKAARIGYATYIGKCEKDGFFYHDENSFVMCSNGNGYVQPCAPGTKNSATGSGGGKGYRDYCDVNLVDYGYTAKRVGKHHHVHGVKTLEGYIHGNDHPHGGYSDGSHGYTPPHSSGKEYEHHVGYKVKKVDKYGYKTYSQKKHIGSTKYHPDPYNSYDKPEGYVAEKHYHGEYREDDPYDLTYDDYGHRGYGHKKKSYGGYGKKRYGYKKKSYGYKKKSYGYKKKSHDGYGGHRGYGGHGGHGGGYGKRRSYGYGYH